MVELDDVIVEALLEYLLHSGRLPALLQTWLDRSEDTVIARRDELKRLRARPTQFDAEASRLLKLVRNGRLLADDPHLASELNQVRVHRISVATDINLFEQQLASGDRQITPDILARLERPAAGENHWI